MHHYQFFNVDGQELLSDTASMVVHVLTSVLHELTIPAEAETSLREKVASLIEFRPPLEGRLLDEVRQLEDDLVHRIAHPLI